MTSEEACLAYIEKEGIIDPSYQAEVSYAWDAAWLEATRLAYLDAINAIESNKLLSGSIGPLMNAGWDAANKLAVSTLQARLKELMP